MRKLVTVLMMLGVAAVAHAVVIGDFEGTSLDGFYGMGAPTPVIGNSTTGATLGSQSLSVNIGGSGYWYLRWDAPTVPTDLGLLTFDLTMIQSEWTAAIWTKVADKIAIGADDSVTGGWKEYIPTADNWTYPDGSPAPIDWGAYNPDETKTCSIDISDFDPTGGTNFFIQFSIQGADVTGNFYIDNVQLVEQARDPVPSDGGIGTIGVDTTLDWTNAVPTGLTSTEVWFGVAPDLNDGNNIPLAGQYPNFLTLIDTNTSPGATGSTAMPAITDGVEYMWVVVPDPNTYGLPFWTFTASTNIPPDANAGVDQYGWTPSEQITLDGSASSDIDPLTYAWTQLSGPPVIIDSPTAAITTVTLAPDLANNTEDGSEPAYVFELVVDDGQFTDSDTVTVTVNSSSCTATIEAGGFYFWGDIAGPGGGGDEFRDCKVDLYDFVELALNWLSCSNTFEACP
jgi:hypothetical protein